jgi:ferredoxin-fold anticodon binding domain-containing protein
MYDGHVVERKNKRAFSDWTDEDFEILGRIGQGPQIKIETEKLRVPSEEKLTEWAESVDALDGTTEIYLED